MLQTDGRHAETLDEEFVIVIYDFRVTAIIACFVLVGRIRWLTLVLADHGRTNICYLAASCRELVLDCTSVEV